MSPYDLRRYHPIAVALIVGIPLVGIALIAWDLSRGGSAREPTDVGSLVTRWTACPSVDVAPWLEAAAEVEAHGLHTPVEAGPCDGPPAIGEVQIRDEGDQVDPLREQVPVTSSAHLVSVGRPVEYGVIYSRRYSSMGARRGELLHGHGIGLAVDGVDGHASSGVLDREHGGISWALVDAVIARRTQP